MKMKSVVLLIVALGCGLVAMLGVQQVMSGPSERQKPSDTVQVLVATARIKSFEAVDESNSAFKAMPRSLVPEGAITSRSECTDKKLQTGAFKGDVISAAKLVDKNYNPSREIPKGMRVVTVKVNQTKIHSGLMRPGDQVDVVLTYRVYKQGAQPIQRTETVLQRVKVFAIDDARLSTIKDSNGNEIKAKNVSLLTTPADGNLLMLAEHAGQLTLALRNESDETIDDNAMPVTTTDLAQVRRNRDASPPDAKFSQLLQGRKNGQNQAKSGDQPGKSVESGNKRSKWILTIYDGSEKRIEEVEDPTAVDPH